MFPVSYVIGNTMKTNRGRSLRCCVCSLAALAVVLILYSCTGDSSTRDYLYATQGGTFTEYDLNGLTITTLAFAPDYAAAKVVVSVNSLPCATRILSKSGETFTLSNGGSSCGPFELNLQYVPAVRPLPAGRALPEFGKRDGAGRRPDPRIYESDPCGLGRAG